MVSHGHILVNGKKIRVPSHIVSEQDTVTIREGSKNKKPFIKDGEKKESQTPTLPHWMTFDEGTNMWKITGMPQPTEMQSVFNFTSIVEFYSR